MINTNLPIQLKNYILRNGTKKFSFWDKFVVGKVYIKSPTNTLHVIDKQQFLTCITKIKQAVDEAYGKSWDFAFNLHELTPAIILEGICIPIGNIDITVAESGYTREAQDCYIFYSLKLDEDFCDSKKEIKIQVANFFRMTFDENFIIYYKSDYPRMKDRIRKLSFHPHKLGYEIHRGINPYFKEESFCYGNGDSGEILTQSFSKSQTKEYLEFFFYTFNNFIRTESKEGVPYKSISKLKDPRVVSGIHSLYQEFSFEWISTSAKTISILNQESLIPYLNLIENEIVIDYNNIFCSISNRPHLEKLITEFIVCNQRLLEKITRVCVSSLSTGNIYFSVEEYKKLLSKAKLKQKNLNPKKPIKVEYDSFSIVVNKKERVLTVLLSPLSEDGTETEINRILNAVEECYVKEASVEIINLIEKKLNENVKKRIT